MKVVYLSQKSKIRPIGPGLSLALGYFDGLHKAHHQLIDKAIKLAKDKNYKTGVLTFHPNPKYILGRNKTYHLLTPHNKKVELLNRLGIDYLFVIKFNESVAKISHKDFVRNFIIPLNVKEIVTGFDYRYGYDGKGNVDTLVNCGVRNYNVHTIQEIKENDQKISATIIREKILKGDVDEVPKYLGRYYSIEGIVIHGYKRGREIGFPTANLESLEEYVLPNEGVYVVYAYVFGKKYKGMCNIGYNPTFNFNKFDKSVEVNIFDFNLEIYNEKIEILFLKKIRDEVKFSSVEALIDQLNNDCQKAKSFFKNNTNNT